MIGILIIAHDTLADGLARAVTHVLGSRPPQFEVLSVAATDDPHALLPAARELVEQLDTGERRGRLLRHLRRDAVQPRRQAARARPRRGHRRRQPADARARVHLPLRAAWRRWSSKAVSGGCEGVLHMDVDPVYAAARG